MASAIFIELKPDVKFDVKDYNDIYSSLIVDPKAIRETLIKKEDLQTLTKIAEYIVEVGPRPDKIIAKLNTRLSVKPEISQKIMTRVNEINAFIKKHNIRATQFQAAFPDLILKVREYILEQNGNLQRFVADSILPIEFQFPGSGPVVPSDFRNNEHYGKFNEALTRALSQGTQEVNWTIVAKSLEWAITDDQSLVTFASPSTKKEEKKSKSGTGKRTDKV